MAGYKWSSFANQHALITVAMFLLGGMISLIGMFKWWQIGIYSIIIGILIGVLEYPRSGKPNSSHHLPRPYQHILARFLYKLGILYTDFFPRFVLYFILSIPALLTLSTVIPAINLMIVAGLYLTGKIRKEEWIFIEPKEETYKKINLIVPPQVPPPREFSQIQTISEQTDTQPINN